MAKWVYSFGDGKAEGKAKMRNLLGGKGANLAEMCNLGLPVPPGFTISTAVCTYFYEKKKSYPKDLKPQVEKGLAHIARITGKKFGDKKNPLLVSVRSGRAGVDARHDGHGAESRPQRRDGGSARQKRQRPPLRL